MVQEPRRKLHLDALTSIRFVAAFHVVLYHNASLITPHLPIPLQAIEPFFRTGYMGVNMFFVLSGFILAYTYLSPGERPDVDRRAFWVARFARIYPLWIASLLLVAPGVLSHFWSQNPPAQAVAKIGASGGAALALIQAWIPQVRAIWNSPGWTLSAEAFFYLLFPLVVAPLWMLPRRAAAWVAGGIWLAGLAPGAIALAFAPEIRQVSAIDSMPNDPLWVFLRSAPIMRLPEFLFGIALARAFYPERGEGARISPRAAGWLSLGSFLAIGGAMAFAHVTPRILVQLGLLGPLYGVLIVGLAHCGGLLERALSWKPLLLLGEASYAVYLLHIPMRAWFFESDATKVPLATVLLYLAVVLGGSIAAYQYLESPARRWIRSRLDRARPAPLAAPPGAS